jgi:hypothetical protein
MTENLVRKSGNGSQEKNNGTWRYLSVPFSIANHSPLGETYDPFIRPRPR